MERDAAWFEAEYNPRVTVAETADLIAVWPPRAAATRTTWPPLADVPTGTHPRETVDVFRASRPRGTLVFIHGGYFRSFSKTEFSFVADGFAGTGLSVALINYPLCPEVSLETLVDSVKRSFAHLLREVLTPAERARIVVAGHSAGGYLTAALVATDWTAHGLPVAPFHGAVPISGVFDLGPLVHTSMNEQIRLDAARAHALDLTRAAPRVAVPVVAAVGAAESAEFRRQSAALAAAWPATTVLEVAGANHFTVLDALAAPGGVLQATVMKLIDRAGAAGP